MSLKSPKIGRASVSGRSQRNFGIAARHRDRDDEDEDVVREDVEEVEEADDGTLILDLEAIRTDGGTQSRAGLNEATVADYAEKMLAGKKFPALTVFHDGKDYWLADGFQRRAAALAADIDGFECDVRQGTQRDAILYSVGANSNHGLPRSPEDKRRAVSKLLLDPEWTQWSNKEIARRCDVSSGLVDKLRIELKDSLPTVGSERTFVNKYGQQTTMQTGSIGKGRVTYGPQEDGHPDEPSIDVDADEADGQPVELQAGMTVRQIHSGQTGVVVHVNYSKILVKTANGLKEYNKWHLEPVEGVTVDGVPVEGEVGELTEDAYERASAMAEQANRAKYHWGSGGEGRTFRERAKYYGFGDEIYDLLQPGATAVTDLNMTSREADKRLSGLAEARLLERFPIDSIVKSTNGEFGKVTGASGKMLEVINLGSGKKSTFYLDSITLSSMEEYEQTPKKHWADLYGKDFEKTLGELGFELAEALELLQPGAKVMRDLTLDYWDVRRRLSGIVQKQLAERFPVGSLVKTPDGHFAEITFVYSTGVHLNDYVTGPNRSLQFDKITLSSQEEFEVALAAVQPSGFERFDDYQAEAIRAVLPALRRVLDFAESKGTTLTLGKDLEQVNDFLEAVEDLRDEREDEDEEET